MARAGEAVTLAEREVTIHDLTLVSWDDTDPARPIAILDVACSAGTYIRALARDLGERLGSGAYLGALRRTAAGPFSDADTIALDTVRAAAAEGPAGLTSLLRPIDTGLARFPEVLLTEDEVAAVARGQFVEAGGRLRARRRALSADDTERRSRRDRRRGPARPPGARQGPGGSGSLRPRRPRRDA